MCRRFQSCSPNTATFESSSALLVGFFPFAVWFLTPRTCWNSGLETQTTCATTKATAARGQPFGCITVPWYHSDWYVMNGHLFVTLGDWDSQPMPGFRESREASCDFVSFLNVQSQDLRMSLDLGYTKAFVQSCRHCKTPRSSFTHIYTVNYRYTLLHFGSDYSHILCRVVFREHIVYSERGPKSKGESHSVNVRIIIAFLFGCFAKVFCLSTDLSWLPTDQANFCQVSNGWFLTW